MAAAIPMTSSAWGQRIQVAADEAAASLQRVKAVQQRLNKLYAWLQSRQAGEGQGDVLKLPRRILQLREALEEERQRLAKVCGPAGYECPWDALADQFLAAVGEVEGRRARAAPPSPSSPAPPTAPKPFLPTTLDVLALPTSLRAAHAVADGICRDLDRWCDAGRVNDRLTALEAEGGGADPTALAIAVFREWYRMQWVRAPVLPPVLCWGAVLDVTLPLPPPSSSPPDPVHVRQVISGSVDAVSDAAICGPPLRPRADEGGHVSPPAPRPLLPGGRCGGRQPLAALTG